MERQVRFSNAFGETIIGTLHVPEISSDRGIVLGHCFTCSRHTGILREIATYLSKNGFMALRFDFSGNGQSEGTFEQSTYSKQVSEMSAGADVLAKEGVQWMGLAGHSLGASVAVLTAAREGRIRAVCAIAGRLASMSPSHFLNRQQKDELTRTGRVHFNSRGRALELTSSFFSDARNYNLPEIIAGLRAPLLVVHGDQDDIVPVTEARRTKEANPDRVELAVFENADHMFSATDLRESTAQYITAWFSAQYEMASI